MKRLFLILCILFVASCSFADMTYTGIANDKRITVTFVPGPFGPGEQGTASIEYDGNMAEYRYFAEYVGPIINYTVDGLCSFMGTENKITAYQPLNVTLTKQSEFVKH